MGRRAIGGSSIRQEPTRRQWLATRTAQGAAAGRGAGLARSAASGVRARRCAQGQPKRGGTLRVATVDKPVNMDPGFAQLYSSLQVYQNVYNKLVYVDEAGQFVPGLAKSWKQDGEKTWLFDLVDNAVFHNGEPFTAEGRGLHLQPPPRRQEQAADARLLLAGGGRGGGRASTRCAST